MKKNYWIVKLVFYCFCFVAYNTTVAQNKRKLMPEDYSLWSELKYRDLSEDGKWIAFVLDYKTTDTLVLQEIATGAKLSLAKAGDSKFSLDSKWFAYVQNDSLKIFDLQRKKIRFIAQNILDFDLSNPSEYIVSSKIHNGKKEVFLFNLNQLKTTTIAEVDEYKLSPDGNFMAVATSEKGLAIVKIVHLSEQLKEKIIATNPKPLFYGLQWDASGKKVAFYQKIVDSTLSFVNHKIYNCTVSKSKLSTSILDPITNPSFPKGFYIPKTKLFISNKQPQVFFDIKLLPDDKIKFDEKSNVEIWLSESLTVPPVNEALEKYNAKRLSVWWTNEDRVVTIEDSLSTKAVLTGDHSNAILYNNSEFFLEPKYAGDFSNYYIKDLYTGEKQLLLPFQSTEKYMVMVSPTGRYISYFKEKQWWVYDIKKKTHTCVTKGIASSFHNFNFDRPGVQPTFGPSEWTIGDKEMLVYDSNDIWKLSPDGKIKKRLTDGIKTNTVYRINTTDSKPSILANTLGYISNTFDINGDLLLKTYNSSTYGEGFALLSKECSPNFLIEKERKLYLIKKPKSSSNYFILESSFEKAPRFIQLDEHKKEKILVESNVQQKHFYWGTSKLIHYETKDRKKLKGALFYPADYDSSKLYPMIVVIYEKPSRELHTYRAPSFESMLGFNATNYTTDGYFVLYPDIAYELDTPGESALKCVESAVSSVMRQASIDPSAIALVGHSFGGYEASYILGKSSLFKTAVIGAPMVDLVSAYLTLDGHGKSNIVRFESSQLRISKPFYSDTFLNNSPLSSLKNIETPVLIWTGENDKQLDWRHAMKLHIGLWKMKKKSTLLVYKKEEHILVNKNNQVDLSIKMQDWLNYYLKNKPQTTWMMP